MNCNIQNNPKIVSIFEKHTATARKQESIGSLGLLRQIHDILDASTAPVVLGMISGLLEQEVQVKEEQKHTFSALLQDIVNNLKITLPSNLIEYIPNTDINYTIDTETEAHGGMAAFTNMVMEKLLITSKHEIWNSLNIFFKKELEPVYSKDEVIKDLLGYVESAGEQEKIRILRELVYLAEESDTQTLLEFFEEAPEHFSEFLVAAKLTNACLYSKISELLTSEKKYYRKGLITALPTIDFDKIAIYMKDYNWDVTAELVETHPCFAHSIVDAFERGVLGISRKFLVDAMLRQERIFSAHADNLTFEELLEMSNKSLRFARKCFGLIAGDSQMLQFCKILSKKGEKICFDFLRECEDQPVFESFLTMLLKSMRLTGSLKDYVIAKYADDGRFFYSLISYLDMDRIEILLEKYYIKDRSLDSLLRIFYPQELILEIHRFRNNELAMKMTDDCVENAKFADNDWVMAMRSLEGIKSGLKAYTSLQLLRHKSRLRSPTIHFLIKSVGDIVRNSQRVIGNFVYCLEYLNEDAMHVFDAMSKEEIVLVLGKSRTLREMVNRVTGRNPANQKLNFLRGCLRSAETR